MREPPHEDGLPASVFADILRTTQVALHAFVRHLTGSGEDARDVVQDVYVDAWRAAQHGSPPFGGYVQASGDTETGIGPIRRWLFRVAYNQAISLVRHRQSIRWESLDSDDEAMALQAVEYAHAMAPFEDQVLEGEVLRAALARLTPEDAACLLLDIVQGFSTAEIARILGIEPAAARKRLSRAVGRLRAAYFAPETKTTHTRERVDR